MQYCLRGRAVFLALGFLLGREAMLGQGGGATGNLPAPTRTAGYLVTNGTTVSWGNIVTGGSGALDCVTMPGVCDITDLVPLKISANIWTGANDFSKASFLRVASGPGVPAAGCGSASDVGKVYMRNDAKASGASLYVCSQTGNGAYAWELGHGSGGAGGSGLPVYDSAGTAIPAHIVTGRNSFSYSQSTIVFSGAAAFTSATSFTCTANNLSNATAVAIAQTNGTSVTFSIQGGTPSDNFSYICIGN